MRNVFLATLIAISVATSAHATNFNVTSLGDDQDLIPDGNCVVAGGLCTLRAALTEAASNPGPHTIRFLVAGTTSPAIPYPSIIQSVTIDGTTAPGYTATSPTAVIDGAFSTAIGFDFSTGSDNSQLLGVKVMGFSTAAVRIASANVTVRHNWIGPVGGGTPNTNGIVLLPSSGSAQIGGPDDGDGNVISGNTAVGLLISGNDHQVRDNYIGTNAAGTAALPNATGVSLQGASGVDVGTFTPGTLNVISGNTGDGVVVDGGATGNRVIGSLIGTDTTGSVALPNGANGVHLIDATGNDVGNPDTITVISGNTMNGVLLDPAATSNDVWAAIIGLDDSGMNALGNGADGVLDRGTGNAIGLNGTGSVISGNGQHGVDVSGATQTTIRSNVIGLASDGDTIVGNGGSGVMLAGGSQLTVGGTDFTDGNVISGNSVDGITIATDNVTVEYNVIGLASDGTTIRGNGNNGISIGAVSAVTIGTTAAPNTISGNSTYGIQAVGTTAPMITGNLAGTTSAGDAAVGNLDDGIHFESVTGGTLDQNVASGNGRNGIALTKATTNVGVLANRVGRDFADTIALPNFAAGISIDDSTNCTIQGGNIIASNNADGVVITGASSGNLVVNGSIYGNAGLGIDLADDGVTANDAQDPDAGPNALQNFPILAHALTGTSTQIDGTINSTPGTAMILSFYANATADPSGFGEGQTHLGTKNVLTDGSGNAAFSFTAPAQALGTFITATASSPSGTSEFSPNVTVTAMPTVGFIVATQIVGEGAGNATVTVTRTGDTTVTSTVDYTTANVTATAGSDYTLTSGTLTFGPGVVSQQIVVPITNDTTDEADETFNIVLSNPQNATLDTTTSHNVTISDDDAPPSITISDVTLAEGNSGTTTFVFSVDLSAASGLPVTVDFATANGTATSPSDYFALSGNMTFNPGVTHQTISVGINGDTTYEAEETFFVNLSNATNATIADGQGLGTITNDDPLPAFTISDFTAAEGNSGTTVFTFNVNLSAASASPVSVDWATADGTATAGSDYTAASGTLVFPAGTTTLPVTVNVLGDTLSETNETFFVNLTNATGATISDGQGLGTITNDDGVPTASINDVTLAEGNAGTTTFTFTVTLSATSGVPVTIDYATANGTATAGSDYTAASGTLTFAPGTTTMPVSVTVTGDTTVEANETFFVNLTNPNGAAIADAQGVGTITNDDVAPTADLAITKTTSVTTYVPGTAIPYTITVSNAGPSSATNVVVTDVLPAGTTFTSATPSQGTCTGTTTVTCSLGTLASGANATINLTITGTGATPIVNSASVAGTETDPQPANNTVAAAAVNPAVAAQASNVPTLSETMMMLLAGALVAVAAMRLRS